MRLPISRLMWLWSYLAPFLRYGDVLAKIAYFSYPFLIRRPRYMFPLEFRAEVNHGEEVMPEGKSFHLHASALSNRKGATTTSRKSDRNEQTIGGRIPWKRSFPVLVTTGDWQVWQWCRRNDVAGIWVVPIRSEPTEVDGWESVMNSASLYFGIVIINII